MEQSKLCKDHALDQAFELIALIGWQSFSLNELAGKLNLPLVEIYSIFHDKISVVLMFLERVDMTVLSQLDREDFNEPRRERLFELLMCRIEALTPYKKSLRFLMNGVVSDPLILMKIMPKFIDSFRLMLEISGYNVQGLKGYLKIGSLAVLYYGLTSDWINDDTIDQVKIMAAIDNIISRVEKYLV